MKNGKKQKLYGAPGGSRSRFPYSSSRKTARICGGFLFPDGEFFFVVTIIAQIYPERYTHYCALFPFKFYKMHDNASLSAGKPRLRHCAQNRRGVFIPRAGQVQ